MRYSVKKVRKYDEWKKEERSQIKEYFGDEDMIFPALIALSVGGSAAITSIEEASTPGLILGGTLALYGAGHSAKILLSNIDSEEIKERIKDSINKIVNKHDKQEENTNRK